MKMYDEGSAGIALRSGFVETHAGNLHVYEDRTQAGNIVFITTDNFKKYIPIKWIEQYMNKYQLHGVCGDEYWTLENMLLAWEDENAESN